MTDDRKDKCLLYSVDPKPLDPGSFSSRLSLVDILMSDRDLSPKVLSVLFHIWLISPLSGRLSFC